MTKKIYVFPSPTEVYRFISYDEMNYMISPSKVSVPSRGR